MNLLEDSLLKRKAKNVSPFSDPQIEDNSQEGTSLSPPSLQLKSESSQGEEQMESSHSGPFQGSKKNGNVNIQMKEQPFQLSEEAPQNEEDKEQEENTVPVEPLNEEEGEEIVATEEEENEEENERQQEEENEGEEHVDQEGQSDEEEDVRGETEEEEQSSNNQEVIEQELQLKLKPGSHGQGCGCDSCTAQMKVRQTKSEDKDINSSAAEGNQTKMPETVQNKMEQSIGADFSNINIHTDSHQADEIGALAYTQGSDIHFSKGQYSPETNTGQELLGHELTHVVQQREGRVQQTTQKKGIPVNDNSGLETEADISGRKAANYNPYKDTSQESNINEKENTQNSEAPVQGIFGRIKRGLKRVGRSIGRGVRRVGRGIRRVGRGIGRGLRRVGRGIRRIGSRIGRGLRRVGRGIRRIGRRIGRGLRRAGRFIWNGVSWVAGKVWDKMKAIYHRVKFFVRSWPKRMQRWASLVWEGVKSLKPWSIEWWKSLGKASTWRKFGFYLFELVLQSAEVLGVTDIVETAMDFVKFNTRGLTSREKGIAQSVFGNSIDYNMVRLDLWAVLGPSWTGREYVSMHTINGWGGQITDDTLIHELTHVWQYEKMGAAYMSRALHAQAVLGSDAYSYGGVAGLTANASSGLSAFNPEAQGNIIQHYYRLKVGLSVDGASASDLPTYQTYVDEVRR